MFVGCGGVGSARKGAGTNPTLFVESCNGAAGFTDPVDDCFLAVLISVVTIRLAAPYGLMPPILSMYGCSSYRVATTLSGFFTLLIPPHRQPSRCWRTTLAGHLPSF